MADVAAWGPSPQRKTACAAVDAPRNDWKPIQQRNAPPPYSSRLNSRREWAMAADMPSMASAVCRPMPRATPQAASVPATRP